MWRQLWPLALALALVAAGAARALAVSPANVNMENDILHFSYELERWLDADKRPCQDFYAFVCSRAVNSTLEQLEERQQQEQQKFDRFLSGNNNDEQLLDAELKLKQFYESCKHARSPDDLKSSLMYRLSGGWPAIDDSSAMIRRRRNMTWMDVVGAFHDVGLNYFFQQRIEVKSNQRVVYLQPDDATRYSLRKFEQLAGEVMQEYAVEAGRARLIALEILSFERNRRDIVKFEGVDGDTQFSYADFKTSMLGRERQIDWDAYFKKTHGKTLRTGDTVIVHNVPKLLQLFELLQNTTMTRLLNWIWIDYLMDKSSSDCQKLAQHYLEPVYQHIVQHASIDKVQMAQMYAEVGRAYEELLPPTTWIDEMSQQNTKLFLGRVIHLTLNGDATLDAEYAQLQFTKRNFYRNLEKAQRLLAQRRPKTRVSAGDSLEAARQLTADFMQVFMAISGLLQQQNLTTPINYALVGEHFAEHLIRGGSSSPTPGAWRSMESEREFAELRQCVAQQQQGAAAGTQYNVNDLVLKLLAQQLALQTYEQWQQRERALVQRVDSLLTTGRLQLSVRKLYFIGSVWAECRQYADGAQKELVHSALRNSAKFRQTFKCRAGDNLYVRNACKVF